MFFLCFNTEFTESGISQEELVPVLVKSMEAMAGPQSIVYMCAENHSQKALELFFELSAQRFDVQRVPLEDMDAVFQDDRIVIAKMQLKRGQQTQQ